MLTLNLSLPTIPHYLVCIKHLLGFQVFLQRFRLGHERALLLLPFGTLIGITIRGKRVLGEHLRLPLQLLRFLCGDFGGISGSKGACGVSNAVGARRGFTGSTFELLRVFNGVAVEFFQLRELLAAGTR